DDLDLHDLAAPDEHVAIGEAPHQMRRDAVLFQVAEEHFRHSVVQHTLGHDGAAFLRVERGRVVLEVLDQEVRIRGAVDLLRLAFVEKLTAVHRRPPRCVRTDVRYAAGPGSCQSSFGSRDEKITASPVLPNPPSPRALDGSASTSSHVTVDTGATTSC